VARAVQPPVAGPLGQGEGVFVEHPGETRIVTPRRGVTAAVGAGRREDAERRRREEPPRVLVEVTELLAHRTLPRRAADVLAQGLFVGDEPHRRHRDAARRYLLMDSGRNTTTIAMIHSTDSSSG